MANPLQTTLSAKLSGLLGFSPAVPLRRWAPGLPLVEGPVLVVGSGADADAVAALLAGDPATDDASGHEVLDGWGLDVHRHAAPDVRYAAVVAVLTGVEHPDALHGPLLTVASTLKGLQRGGRVVTISHAATADDAPAVAAARQGIDAVVRTVAKESRGGATANGLVLADGVPVTAASVVGGLRFLLSTRSAFVHGQLLGVDSDAGALPTDWERPLVGRVAVVTGAARGIGAAIARTLARDGATVVAVDVPAAGEQLAHVANAIRGTALQLDITADDAGARILEHTLARHGRIDVVVHNAGITRDKLFANMTDAQWDAVIAVNIAAQLRINEALLTSGDFTDAPRIVSISSTTGFAGNRGQANYAATKGGVIGMVRATAPLLEPFGGTANAVAPGFIETEMTAKMPALTRQVARQLSSLQQGGQPVDVAEAVAFLASPQAGGIVGRTLRVCGQNVVGA
ncbi:3-oxoacyl-ACP reductase [Cellulomonas gilvus]|uniref:Short-chain dehydrogenase/reductase SDR n=1 Tax=Cellulomonas gilvus (strain ATCC 13127 / NRRL B-14078) TaxID=593907 RepID=F8A4I2_CELGA|nr:3-oxoacyl-ACP reductase [Cellulomonas gilvus]AEI13230.1 short-chain dehydrogenase/reductase SDR [Cellulomonas gilvus ATCC 13127]